jgi:hypothetical protein
MMARRPAARPAAGAEMFPVRRRGGLAPIAAVIKRDRPIRARQKIEQDFNQEPKVVPYPRNAAAAES